VWEKNCSASTEVKKSSKLDSKEISIELLNGWQQCLLWNEKKIIH